MIWLHYVSVGRAMRGAPCVVMGSSPICNNSDLTKDLTGIFLQILKNSSIHYVNHIVTLAQLVERLTFNQVVVGSSPSCDKFFLQIISDKFFYNVHKFDLGIIHK